MKQLNYWKIYLTRDCLYFTKRWKCLNIQKNESEDFTTYASVINKTYDDFRLSELTADNFKRLIFVLDPVSKKDSDMRRRILSKLENKQNMSLQLLADYCQQCINIKQDSQKIEEAAIANVRKIYRKHHSSSPRLNWKSPSSTNKKTPSACYGCGQFRCWFNDCPYKYKICRNFNRKGHKMSRKLKQS